MSKEFNILSHKLVPEHKVLSEKEKEEVLRRYGASLRQFPRILASDPVVKELGAKPGDLIMVRRKSPTAGESIYYRVVVRG